MAKGEDVELSRRIDSEVSHDIKSVDVQRGGEQRSTFDIREELSILRRKCAGLYGENGNPEMEPMEFETLCQEAGANSIYFRSYENRKTNQ